MRLGTSSQRRGLMKLPIVPLLLTCGPTVLSTFALLRSLRDYKSLKIGALPLTMVSGAWLIAAYATYVFIRYTVEPSPYLPPWKDPETLDFGLLFLLAPLGFVFTMISKLRGASKSAVLSLAVAMLVLFIVGLLEGASV